MIFTLTDRQYNVLDILETDAYLIGQYTSSLLNTLDIDIPVKSLNPEKWVEGNYILCVDKSGTKYWFTITDFSDSLNADVKTLTCYSGSLDVIAEDAVPISAPEAKPFSWYFDSIFYDTGVTLGINEISDLSRKLEYTSDDKSQAEMLQFVLNGFDAEARFEVEFQGSTPTSLKLNVVKHIGKEAVQTVLTNYDDSLTSLDRTGSISELGTCLNLSGGTPDGADKAITLAGKEYVEKDAAGNIIYYSPKAHFRIYSVAARNNYFVQLPGKTNGEFDGYINRTYVSEATTQDALWQAGLTKLKSIDHAIFEYTASGKINCNLGDNIQIIAHKMKEEVMISARVIEYKFNDDDDSRNEYTFSNVKELKSQFDQSLIERVNALIEQTKPYTLSFVSDNGVTFKNIEGKTTLSAIVYNGTQVITPDVTVRWYKDDVWVKTGYSLTIEAKNINAKAVYKAIVIDTNGKERATQDVTVFNVDDGRGIKGKPVLSYASSGSINAVPTTWQSTIPAVPAGSYLWTREVTTYSDNTTSEIITPVLQGPKGNPGNDGIAGKDGIGIKSTQIMYAQSTSGTTAPKTGWTSQVPTLIKGQYLWTQTTWLYTDNTGESGYTVSYNAKDGNTGSDGIAGKDGVGIADTIITYAPSTSGTTAPTSGYTQSVPSVAEGSFLWTKTVWTYTDGTNETGYSVAKQGVKGADGKDGKSITDSKQEWAASTSGTTAPTTWQTTIPTVTAGQYLWSRITETWSDNSKTYKFTIGKIGENGQNAQMMFLSATTNQMMFNADNTPKTAQSSVVTAKYQNVTGTVAFTAKGIKTDGTSETLTLTGSGDSRTITSAMFKTDWVMINVTATLAGLTDTLSIVKVNDGAQGIGGKNGYFHSAWAMSADGRVGFSTTDSTGKWYIGTYFDFVEADSTDPARYNWLELAGAVNMYFAYTWSPDGTDRFTRAKPEPTQDELAKDYDNAVPRYIGRSLKDSTNPADFKFEPNPDRKPWTTYAQGLNGEGLSLMPYGENKVIGSDNGYLNNHAFYQGDSKLVYSNVNGWRKVMLNGVNLSNEFVFDDTYITIVNDGRYTQSIIFDTDANVSDFSFTFFSSATAHQYVTAKIEKLSNGYYRAYSSKDLPSGFKLRVADFNVTSTGGTYISFRYPKLELANTMGIPTPWTPAPSEDPLGAIPKYVGTAALPYEDFSKYAYTMNPEWADLNATLGLNTKVDNGQYQDDKSQIFEDIANRLTKEEAAEINTIAQKALDMITAYTDPDSGKAAADLNALEQRIVGMVNELGAKIARWNFIDTWMTAGEEGFSIANAKSTTKFLVKNNRMSFINNGEEVAYFSGQSFMIQRGIVTQGMQIGSHKEEALNKDHTVTRWIAS